MKFTTLRINKSDIRPRMVNHTQNSYSAPRCRIEGGGSAVYSLPPPTIPAGPRLELANIGLGVQLSNHLATTSHESVVFVLCHGSVSPSPSQPLSVT